MSRPAGSGLVPVYLVRHGITPWNEQGLVQGWTDIPLSDTGRAQARGIAEGLASSPVARIITSTLSRAGDTAAEIAGRHSLDVEAFEELREYNCGEWEGRSYLQIRADERDRFWAWFNDPETPTPGGESMVEASRRAVPIVEAAITETARTVSDRKEALVVVAHGGVIRLIAAHLLGVDIAVAKRLRLDNASLSILEPFLGAYTLKLWNSVAHLNGLAGRED